MVGGLGGWEGGNKQTNQMVPCESLFPLVARAKPKLPSPALHRFLLSLGRGTAGCQEPKVWGHNWLIFSSSDFGLSPCNPCCSCSCAALSHPGPLLADPSVPKKHPQAPMAGRVEDSPWGRSSGDLAGTHCLPQTAPVCLSLPK